MLIKCIFSYELQSLPIFSPSIPISLANTYHPTLIHPISHAPLKGSRTFKVMLLYLFSYFFSFNNNTYRT